MPLSLLDEPSLRERIGTLCALYDRGRRRLTTLAGSASRGEDAAASVEELSHVLADINQAEPTLRQLVEAWSKSDLKIRQRLSADVAQLQQSAAACLALVSSAEQTFAQHRNQVSGQLDDGATRNRAVRAYANAMRQ